MNWKEKQEDPKFIGIVAGVCGGIGFWFTSGMLLGGVIAGVLIGFIAMFVMQYSIKQKAEQNNQTKQLETKAAEEDTTPPV